MDLQPTSFKQISNMVPRSRRTSSYPAAPGPQPRQAALAALPAPPEPRPASRLPPRPVTKGPAPRPSRLLTPSWPREGSVAPRPPQLPGGLAQLLSRVGLGKDSGNANSSRVTKTSLVYIGGATVIKPKVGV